MFLQSQCTFLQSLFHFFFVTLRQNFILPRCCSRSGLLKQVQHSARLTATLPAEFHSTARTQKMKHTATNRRQQAAMTFTSDCLNILTQLEDRLSVMVDQRVEAAVERKFRQMNINNNK